MDPRVRQLFKLLLYMGKEYPQESGGYAKFSQGLKRAFRSTSIQSEEDMTKALAKGEYITKGMCDDSIY
ncbi:CIC11C00000002968 [Sungouiella intermedia]|uniref:CIC11C00000002968 n=1 Tax=Sungouiella intermedia TaxID=45354 RepID=A0A1L0DIZ6_9ASCO|nr:CIC11C00000002968 [[Candida] intermedia]